MEQMQANAAATPAPERPLVEEITEVLAVFFGHQPDTTKAATGVVQLLMERGHVLMGAPPAQQILADAKQFAEQLTLTMLALRILNMLAWNNVQTPETKPARKWIDDYLQGINHGPAGKPMLWPAQLPGMAQLLRDWGFQPTVALPGRPSYVARALPNPTVQ